MEGKDINAPTMDVVHLRRKVGMVFQKPNPFPKSIFDNVAYGPKIHGMVKHKTDAEELVVKQPAKGWFIGRGKRPFA